jgi:rhamnosyltransferase
MKQVCCIIVAYNHCKVSLTNLATTCLEQKANVVVVNNGNADDLFLKSTNAIVLQLSKNEGIATAQNIGVQYARQTGATYLAFFDQDSLPSLDFLQLLQDTFESLESSGKRPAAVGPQIVDAKDGVVIPFVQFGVWGVKKGRREEVHGAVPADFLIASGMLTSVERFHEIGKWESGLFIDNVDFEWCFRARAKGYRCYGVPEATLEHSIGDAARNVGIGQKGRIAIHSPVRQYYIMRNRIHMYKRRYVPLAWKIQDVPRAIFKSVYFPTMVKSRWQNAKAIAKGLWDGLTNIYGPIDGRYRRSGARQRITE